LIFLGWTEFQRHTHFYNRYLGGGNGDPTEHTNDKSLSRPTFHGKVNTPTNPSLLHIPLLYASLAHTQTHTHTHTHTHISTTLVFVVVFLFVVVDGGGGGAVVAILVVEAILSLRLPV
jgi:hypothetical protein